VEGKPAAGRHSRTRKESGSNDNKNVSLGQLAVAVAYHYKLRPCDVAQFSGQQLVMWHERAFQEIGLEKNLALEISLVPHTENPERALADMRFALEKMGRNSHG
jgi:hypothetical protein